MPSWIFTLINAYAVFVLAVISPGPDFAVTVRTSVSSGRRAGLACAAGVATANALHIFLVRFGIGPVVTGNPAVYQLMLYAAGAFLAYLGVKSLRAALRQPAPVKHSAESEEPSSATARNPFFEGFLVNILNGKAIAFWLSYFTIVMRAELPGWAQIGFPVLLAASLFAWFAFVAVAMSHDWVRSRFLRYERSFNGAMGALLLILAGQILAEAWRAAGP